jgi:uncharacterized protein (TIGR02246 family)
MAGVMQAAGALDVDRFMTFFARDSALLVAFSGQSLTGWQAVAEAERDYWSTLASVAYDVQGMRTSVLAPTIALTTSFGTIQETPRVGEIRKGGYFTTWLWQLRPEGWRIVHAHESGNP